MNRWKLIAGIVLLFAAGALSGILGTSFYMKEKMKPYRQDPAERRAALVEELTRRLDLKLKQIPEIENILDDLDRRRQEYRQVLRNLRTASISRMKEALSPEQQEKLDQLQQEWEVRKNQRRSRK